MFFLTNMGFPTWEKFPHFPVFFWQRLLGSWIIKGFHRKRENLLHAIQYIFEGPLLRLVIVTEMYCLLDLKASLILHTKTHCL